MVDKGIKYGVNQFINEVSIEILGETDLLKSPKYKYVIEFAEGQSHNGNGHQFMKIYTDGELDILQSGNWKISPVIKMPFDWTGYWVNIEISDLNNAIAIIKHKPDGATQPGKVNFILDIEYVFKSINELLLIEDKEHFDVLGNIKETISSVNIVNHIYRESTIPIQTISKELERIKNNVSDYENIKERLKPEFVDYLKTKLNSAIETYNGFKARLIE